MKKSTVYVKNYSLIYENNEYTFEEILEKNIIFKYIKIVILEEMLYIKSFPIKLKINDLEKYIFNKITDIFPENGEILYDYEKNYNKDYIYIYSIKGREKIERLCRESTLLEIVPIQFVIREYLNKVLNTKKEDYMVVTQLYNKYYFIECNNGVFVDNYVTSNHIELHEYLKQKNIKGKIFVDKDCNFDEYYLNKVEIIKMNIVGLINEKV